MFGSSILEAAIGLAFVYLLFSLICSVVNEGISTFLNIRGETLKKGIVSMLGSPDAATKAVNLADEIYAHGLISTLELNEQRLPAYIPPNSFAAALVDILHLGSLPSVEAAKAQKAADAQKDAAVKLGAAQANNANAEASDPNKTNLEAALTTAKKNYEDAVNDVKAVRDTFRAGIATVPLDTIEKNILANTSGGAQKALLTLLEKTRREYDALLKVPNTVVDEVELFEEHIEEWFDSFMDRVGGWYKRWTQWVTVVIAVVVVFASNADTIVLTKRLLRDDTLRASVVVAAQDAVLAPVQPTPAPTTAPPANDANKTLPKDKETPSRGETAAPTPVPNVVQDPAAREKLIKTAAKLNLPFGWERYETTDKTPPETDEEYHERVPDCGDWSDWSKVGIFGILGKLANLVVVLLTKLFGLMITVLAVSLGAPFWFDTLSRFINLRGTGTPPGETKKGGDRKTT